MACIALMHHPGELLNAITADLEEEAQSSECERKNKTDIVWVVSTLTLHLGACRAPPAWHRLAQP